MQSWHITLSSSHRRTLFPTEALLRAAVRVIDGVVGDIAVMFCVVDDHVHVWVLATRDRIAAIAAALRRALAPRAAGPIDVVHFKPVETRAHQRSLVGYLLDQLEHHGIEASPALWSGGCYQDLVGARCLDRFRPRIRQVLPRLRRDELDRAVGLAPGELREASGDELRRAGPMGIAEAALAAVAASCETPGRPRFLTRARRAAAHLASAVGLRTGDLADALELPPRTVRRLLSEAPEDQLLRALRLQVRLRGLRLGASPWPRRAASG